MQRQAVNIRRESSRKPKTVRRPIIPGGRKTAGTGCFFRRKRSLPGGIIPSWRVFQPEAMRLQGKTGESGNGRSFPIHPPVTSSFLTNRLRIHRSFGGFSRGDPGRFACPPVGMPPAGCRQRTSPDGCGPERAGMQNARLFGALARAGMVMVGEKAGGNR